MVVAAYLPKEVLNKAQKLVLMKIADSADDQTRLARPGLERMMAWAGVGEKQVSTLVTQLVGLGLVERVTIGRVGTRAEYRVFPYGVPPIPSTEELAERRRAAQQAPTNPGSRAAVRRAADRRRRPAHSKTSLIGRRRSQQRKGLWTQGCPWGTLMGLRTGSPWGTQWVAAGKPGRGSWGNFFLPPSFLLSS